MQSIRILLADVPRLLRDIIHSTVSPQPDLQIVGETPERRELLPLADATAPDVVILGAATVELPTEGEALLFARPRTKVLAITDAGRDALLYELRPHRVPIGNVSPLELLAAIRSAAAPPPGPQEGRREC